MRGFAPLSNHAPVASLDKFEGPLIRRAFARHLLPQGEKANPSETIMTLTTLIPAALAAILLAGAAHAAPQPAAVKPVLSIKVCTRNCLDPETNGPALSGRAVHAAVKPVLSIRTCTKRRSLCRNAL